MAGQLDIDFSIDDKGIVRVTRYPMGAAEVMPRWEFERLLGILIKVRGKLSVIDCVAAVGKIIHQRRENQRRLKWATRALLN
jgi:hypothetical protein